MKKRLSVILVIIWMLVIFIMSSFNSNDSSSQSNFIVNIISIIFNINNIDVLSLIIRKMAHFTEYLILGLLVCNLIKQYNKKMFIAFIICILYAISDEIHQLFVDGRSCQLFDIMIDSVGSTCGILLYNIKNIIKIYRKKL